MQHRGNAALALPMNYRGSEPAVRRPIPQAPRNVAPPPAAVPAGKGLSRAFIAYAVCWVVCVALAILMVSRYVDLLQVQGEIARLEREISQLERDTQRLRADVSVLKDPQRIERVAVGQLNMVKAGSQQGRVAVVTKPMTHVAALEADVTTARERVGLLGWLKNILEIFDNRAEAHTIR